MGVLGLSRKCKARLADEYDAAQERGEVATVGWKSGVDKANTTTAADLGLRRDEIFEARQIRDAEIAQPGIIERTLTERAAAGLEPTKAALKEAVEQAVKPFVANNSGNNEWYTPAAIVEADRVA